MSTLLRTSKFIRCLGTCRNVNIRLEKLHNLAEKSATHGTIQNAPINFIRPYGSNVKSYQDRFSVERCLHNLDFEVRKKDRISAKDISDVVYAIRSSGEISSSQALLLLRCCGKLVVEETPEKRTELVAEVMSSLKDLKVPLDISHYNALLKVYLENKTEFSPFEFLQDLNKNNILPNRVTYTYLIGASCIFGDIAEATKMLEIMKKNNVPINTFIFNYLIIGHAEANDMASAEDMVVLMKEKGIKPDAGTYASLLYGHAKFGNIKDIRKILHLCKQNDIFLTTKDFTDIIFSLTINGHSQYVDEIFDHMKVSMKYSQELVNLSFRLINEGYDEMAVKVFKRTPIPDHSPQNKTGAFLIHYLLRHNQPISRIIKIAKMLKEEGINDVAFITALRELLVQERKDEAIYLFKNMNDNGMEIRPHYFYPLFCQAGRYKDNKMVIELVRLMKFLNVPRAHTTVKYFITPNYQVTDVIHDFGLLLTAGIRNEILAEGLFAEYAVKGDLKSCELLATNFYLLFDKRWTRGLIEGLVRSGDVKTFVNIHAHLFDSYLLGNRLINDEAFTDPDNESFNEFNPKEENGFKSAGESGNRDKEFGEFILRQINVNSKAQRYLKSVAKGFLENGIGIRQSAVEALSNLLETSVPEELLHKLASPDLKHKPVVKSTIFEEEFPVIKVRKPASNRADFSEGDKNFLVLVNAKYLDQAEEMFEKFKADNALNVFRYGSMMKLYCSTGNYEKAVKCGDEMKANFPEEMKTDFLTLYYVEALINVKRVDEGLSVFRSMRNCKGIPETLFVGVIEKYIANTGELEIARKLLEMGGEIRNVFHPRHYIIVLNEYFKRKDYKSIVDLFCEVVEKYDWALSRDNVLREVISSGNSELLEKVTETLINHSGELTCTLDLAVAYAKLNNVKEVRRLFKETSFFFSDESIKAISDRLANNGHDTAIACLLEASNRMSNINRRILYDYYLESLEKNDNPTKALNIWTQMQEEDVIPSETFLTNLSNYLQKRGLAVPFAIGNERLNSKGKSISTDGLTEAIKENDFDKFCEVLDYLVRSKRRIPFATVNSYIRNEVVSKGKIEKLKKVRQIIPTMKYYVTWEAMTLIAYTVNGKRKEYLQEKFEDLSSKRWVDPITKIPFRTLLATAFEDATLIEELKEVEKEAKKNNMEVYSSVIWTYYILNKDLETAKNYLPQNMSQTLDLIKNFGQTSKQNNNNVLDTILDIKDEIKLTDKDVEGIYNDYLFSLKLRDDVEQMQNVLNRAVNDKKDHLIRKDMLEYIKKRTQPNFIEYKVNRVKR